ncbi:MAG: hypothetical protein VX730_07615 [Pseudomonadota bacterium]|nr:hypothetical protein [Pseudomonadota bacterium]
MKTKAKPFLTLGKHTPIHVIAVIAFMILLSQFALFIAILAVTTFYSFWMNLDAYWRMFYDKDPKKEWRDPSGYYVSTIFFTALFCVGLPFGAWLVMGQSLLYMLVTIGAVNLFTAFYGYGWGSAFDTKDED